jgi:MoaA/NifB/PqqE/SkfB family radical SAM enzyme
MTSDVATGVPKVALAHLDALWFQVAGTLCNLTCAHCFISCSPHNRRFGFLDLATVMHYLDEAVALGVKEYYFTGGEPFFNPDMTAILEATLKVGPATVLTNATVLKEEWLSRLKQAEENSPYSLEFRVSLDGFTPEENDPIRGQGVFIRTMRGVQQLLAYGFLPIITVTRTRDDEDDQRLIEGFLAMLRAHGYDRPRLKLLPTLRIGAEENRQRGYRENERVTLSMMNGFDETQLICNHSRIVTDHGVHVCPILIESPAARLGETLSESLTSFALSEQACYTCWQYGNICSNSSSLKRDA